VSKDLWLMSATLVIDLSPVSATLVINLSPVSTTQAINHTDILPLVVETGDQLFDSKISAKVNIISKRVQQHNQVRGGYRFTKNQTSKYLVSVYHQKKMTYPQERRPSSCSWEGWWAGCSWGPRTWDWGGLQRSQVQDRLCGSPSDSPPPESPVATGK